MLYTTYMSTVQPRQYSTLLYIPGAVLLQRPPREPRAPWPLKICAATSMGPGLPATPMLAGAGPCSAPLPSVPPPLAAKGGERGLEEM